jgi:hypothetical protein
MDIQLNEAEQKLARYLAKNRYEQARKLGVENKKMGPQSNEMTDLQGIGAEIAFCKMHNIYPDMNVGSTPLEDATLRDGTTVDVKSTVYKNGRLIVAMWKNPAIDCYALMVGTFPNYRYAGMMSSKEMMQESRILDLGHGPVYAASQGDLK